MPACPACKHPDAVAGVPCPHCGTTFSASPATRIELEPVAYGRARPSAFPVKALLALLLVAATAGWFVRDRMQAKPALVLQAGGMNMLYKAAPGQGFSAYELSQRNGRVEARLLPDARKNLSSFSANAQVVLLGTVWCSWCAQARRQLDAAKVKYTDYDVEQNAEAGFFHSRVLRAEGVPVIIIGDRVLLGYNEAELRAASIGPGK